MSKQPVKRRSPAPSGFPKLLREIKDRIHHAQARAMQAANLELVRLYWDIGRMIDLRQEQECVPTQKCRSLRHFCQTRFLEIPGSWLF